MGLVTANSCFFTFGFVHKIPDRILRIVESDRIAIHLYSLVKNPNTDKPIDIQSRLIINIQEVIREAKYLIFAVNQSVIILSVIMPSVINPTIMVSIGLYFLILCN